MKVFEIFFDSWDVIAAISTIVGIIALLVPIDATRSTETINMLKALKRLIFVTAILFLSFLGIVHLAFVKVPNVKGVSADSAMTCLRQNDLDVKYLPNLKSDNTYLNLEVNFQSIDGGEMVFKGRTIYLGIAQDIKPQESNTVISDSQDKMTENIATDVDTDTGNRDEKKVIVPDVVGMEQDDAIRLLYMSGLQYQVYWQESSDKNEYYVVYQSYKSKEIVKAGTIVELALSPTLPESISYKEFVYELDDSLVKNANELNGFYVYGSSVAKASFYSAIKNDAYYPDYITEKLCQVSLNIIGADDAVLGIYMEGEDIGIIIGNDAGKSELYINKGNYKIGAHFDNDYKAEYVCIDSSGQYEVDFTK